MNYELILKELKQKLESHKNPVVGCSFGKDSMVLLWMIHELGFNIPVLTHWSEYFNVPYREDCVNPNRFAFINKIIKDWDLKVIYWPASNINFFSFSNNRSIVFEFLHVADFTVLYPHYFKKFQDERFSCVLDIISDFKPSELAFEPDLYISGVKSSDYIKDEQLPFTTEEGYKNKLMNDKYSNINIFSPLLDLSDDEIWNYIVKNDIPHNKDLYTNRRKNDSGEEIFGCWNCIDDYGNKEVWCPKYKFWTHNVQCGRDNSKATIKLYMDHKIFV